MIRSPKQLARRLHIGLDNLVNLAATEEKFIRWVDKKTGRSIQQPKPALESVHNRIGDLLSRIETPDFLHSAKKGRSYVSNALPHASSHRTVKIDIRKFYPSTRAQAVYHFFKDRLSCAGDVAGILATLLTVDGHLATGSSASSILSFFAYEDMFAEIHRLADERGCTMTLYVDDIVISGPGATRRLIYEIKCVVKQYGLRAHKTKLFKSNQPKIITGVAVTSAGTRLPNKRQKSIGDGIAAFRSTPDGPDRLAGASRLVSRMFEAAQVDPAWLPKAKAMLAQKRNLGG